MKEHTSNINNISSGTLLMADSGFTCLKENETCIVYKDDIGLYVKCSGGDDFNHMSNKRNEKHYLDGQIDENKTLIGFKIIG